MNWARALPCSAAWRNHLAASLSVGVIAGVTLRLTGGTFTVASANATPLSNAGVVSGEIRVNTGTILIFDTAALTNRIAPDDGLVQVNGTLRLDDSSINDGEVTVSNNGLLESFIVAGTSVSTLSNLDLGDFTSAGEIRVNTGTILIFDTAALTNRIAPDDGLVQVNGTLRLDDSSINDGEVTVSNNGLLESFIVAGASVSTLSNLDLGDFTNAGEIRVNTGTILIFDTAALTNRIAPDDGLVQVNGTLRLDDSSIDQGVVTVSDTGLLETVVVAGASVSTLSNLDLANFTNDGTIRVNAFTTLIFVAAALNNDGGLVEVVFDGTLQLDGSQIDNGIVTNHGLLEATAGISTLSNLASGSFLNDGDIEVAGGAELIFDSAHLVNHIPSTDGNVLVTGTLRLDDSSIDQGVVTINAGGACCRRLAAPPARSATSQPSPTAARCR